MRVGIGYDVHCLAPGRKLMLGGVNIPFEKGLAGHSDGDVLIHAIIDALLGAVALKDIGAHFPANYPRYEGVSSLGLLQQVRELLRMKQFKVGNIDATVVAERPCLAPFIDQICLCLSEALGISLGQVGIKATTNEGLGFTGREEGIAAYAVVLVEEA